MCSTVAPAGGNSAGRPTFGAPWSHLGHRWLAPVPATRRYCAWMSQPRYISAVTASVTNSLASARRRRCRPRADELARALRVDLGLHDAGAAALVDRAEQSRPACRPCARSGRTARAPILRGASARAGSGETAQRSFQAGSSAGAEWLRPNRIRRRRSGLPARPCRDRRSRRSGRRATRAAAGRGRPGPGRAPYFAFSESMPRPARRSARRSCPRASRRPWPRAARFRRSSPAGRRGRRRRPGRRRARGGSRRGSWFGRAPASASALASSRADARAVSQCWLRPAGVSRGRAGFGTCFTGAGRGPARMLPLEPCSACGQNRDAATKRNSRTSRSGRCGRRCEVTSLLSAPADGA